MSEHHEAETAAIRRLHEATNSADVQLISRTVEELFEPDAVIRTPLSIESAGAQAITEIFATLLHVYPSESHRFLEPSPEVERFQNWIGLGDDLVGARRPARRAA